MQAHTRVHTIHPLICRWSPLGGQAGSSTINQTETHGALNAGQTNALYFTLPNSHSWCVAQNTHTHNLKYKNSTCNTRALKLTCKHMQITPKTLSLGRDGWVGLYLVRWVFTAGRIWRKRTLTTHLSKYDANSVFGGIHANAHGHQKTSSHHLSLVFKGLTSYC